MHCIKSLKSLGVMGLMVVVLVACQSSPKVGEPVSNGEYEITVVSAERQEIAPGFDVEVLAVMVDIQDQYLTESIVRAAGATVTDSEGHTYEPKEYGKDYGIDDARQLAFFVFVVPKSAKHFKFQFGSFPLVDLGK